MKMSRIDIIGQNGNTGEHYMDTYEVLFMRGDHYIVEASSESQAYAQVVHEHPECQSYDILDIRKVTDPS